MNVLDELIAGSLADAEARSLRVSQRDLIAQLDHVPSPRPVLPSFDTPDISVIAEVKRSSPSKGALAEIADPAALAAQYEAGGASAISVLTEKHRFGGSLNDLDAVRSQVSIPVLRKDFLVTEYQLIEARVHGADLALLIVAGLDDDALAKLYKLTVDLGMTPLVEVHNVDEAKRAVDLGAPLIGINNRDLTTLHVDLANFGRVVEHLPAETVMVAESGITGPADVARLASEGANVVLVGEALVKDNAPAQTIQAMIEAARTTQEPHDNPAP